MEFHLGAQSDIEALKSLLLDIAQECQECPLDHLLNMIVQRLAERPLVGLARIWLIQPGDICQVCRMAPECPDQTACLHLVASAGKSSINLDETWSRLDGDFRRFPLGIRKVGRVAGESRAVAVVNIQKDSEWIVRPEWAREEGIRGFCGQPLICRGETLGVLGVFMRTPLEEPIFDWLRLIADHAAAAITNSRAFEEIEFLRAKIELENEYLREEVREAQAFGGIVGQGPAMRKILDQIELVAPTAASVLILGESGTGKELVAREIHLRSERKDRPMIKVNCASVPRELYESEFFGHTKGAFTGALRDRAGRFEAADGGTIFLDEVGEIPLDLQSKLLRVLQEGEYERLGEERTRKVDVRVIAATNRNLKSEVDAGRFRQDLYYRLNVFPVEVSPLRERKEDIPVLASHFLELESKNLGQLTPRFTQANVMELQRYDWPGNVRELQNVIQRAVILSQKNKLSFDLPAKSREIERTNSLEASSPNDSTVLREEEMRHRERENVHVALQSTNWKIYGSDGAAALLGIRPTTLVSRIKKMGLKRED